MNDWIEIRERQELIASFGGELLPQFGGALLDPSVGMTNPLRNEGKFTNQIN